MFNKGLHQFRFEENAAERIFAEEWEKKNTSPTAWDSESFLDGRGTLDYLLAKDNNSPAGEVSDRDRTVAATVVQWLGSPVGLAFLADVQKRRREERINEKERREQEKVDKVVLKNITQKGW